MTKEDLQVLKKVFNEQVSVTDILGEHKGIIHCLEVRGQGVYAYGLFFGMNQWLRLNESTMKWEHSPR